MRNLKISRGVAAGASLVLVLGVVEVSTSQPLGFRALLVSVDRVDPERLREWRRNDYNTIALEISGEKASQITRAAAEQVRSAGFSLYFWFEIGRNSRLADAHPEWMASLQGHSEWRRYFSKLRTPAEGEVVKNYPWVPVLYRESFNSHLERVRMMLERLPAPDGILLNDLQGPPSACGCGNLLCRWTADYGPIVTATRLPSDAAARFVSAVRALRPGARVIPIWTTECEEADKVQLCAGVGCFAGACWKEFTTQLMPLANEAEQIGVLLTFRGMGRDLARYGLQGGWVRQAFFSFQEMPPKRGGRAVATNRLIAVLQGWDVTPEEQKAQINRCSDAGAGGFIMALERIEQGWEPRIIALKSGRR